MASGGYRPGSGPAKGTKYKPRVPKPGAKKPKVPTEKNKLKNMLALGIKAKAKFYQEFLLRISHGERLTVSEQKMMDKLGVELTSEIDEKTPEPNKSIEKLEPLEYMLKVMNDPAENPDMRARMAVSAAPYRHSRKGEGAGKKDEQAGRAKAAGAGRFSSSAPPKLAVVKK